MEKRVLLNGQSDGLSPENRPDKSGTLLSNETLEMRRGFSELYENTVDNNSAPIIETINDSSSATTVEETPVENTYIEPRELRNGN